MHRARELFAKGVLPARYAKPAESFVETAAPVEFRDFTNNLPPGYIFSDWLRCAAIKSVMCVAVRQLASCIPSCPTIIYSSHT